MKKSVGAIVLQASVALYLLVSGICGLARNPGSYNVVIKYSVEYLFSGNISVLLIIIISICSIMASVILVIDIFNIELKYSEQALLIFLIIWLFIIFLNHIYAPIKYDNNKFLSYLTWFNVDIMVLGGIACATRRFGGR